VDPVALATGQLADGLLLKPFRELIARVYLPSASRLR
jgi:hypothetical protein